MQEFIRLSLEYIEQNLKTDITAEELAQMSNYSVWHYYRLFSQITGSSVSNYILKRRLDHVISEMSAGRKAVDIVLEYGFDTYAGFYKAFVKMYGCSPKKYLSINKNHTQKNKLEALNMYNEKELLKILENWDIPKDTKIEDVTEYDWKRWKIGEYYLTTNERSKMIRNIKIAKALTKQEFSSHFLPILTKTGEDYLDGENIFILTQKKGEPLDNLIKDEKNEEFAAKYGQSIAKLHKAFKYVQDDVKPDDINIYKQITEWAFPIVQKFNKKYNQGISDDFFNDYIETFGKLYEKLPRQFIHRNAHDGNIFFENGEPTSWIGFEYYNEYNVRIFDILYGANNDTGEWRKNIIKGYNSVNPLTAEEKQALYYVMCSIDMIFIAWGNNETDENSCGGLLEHIKNKDNFCNIF